MIILILLSFENVLAATTLFTIEIVVYYDLYAIYAQRSVVIFYERSGAMM